MTVKAVALGLFLAFVFGSANAYLGMRAGQTVAATIPAAVIAMALFRLPIRGIRGGILEQNIARTAASVGEALVAGAIFTIPAFVLVDIQGVRLWRDLRAHYWEASFILLVGGLIGVFFIILLRRPLCVEADLPWPESVASVEIVKAGDRAGAASRYIFGAMGFGGLIMILKSDKGLQIFRDYTEGFLAFPKSVVRHFNFDRQPIGDVTHTGGIAWSTPSLSPALLGIGYIIGPKLASINVSGGVIAWWLLIPLLLFFDPDLPARLGNATPDVAAYTVWYNIVRPIAVGTMLVAAFYTLFYDALVDHSVRCAAPSAPPRRPRVKQARAERTERDIPPSGCWLESLVLLVPITAIYYFFTHGWVAAIVSALVMTVTGFLLSAVGGYLVGLVGSSNQPVSGLDALGAGDRGAGAAGDRGEGAGGRGGGAGSGGGGLLRLLRLGVAGAGPEGRPPAGRNPVEDAGGGDHRRGAALLLPDGADHRAARSQPGDGRHWRPRACRRRRRDSWRSWRRASWAVRWRGGCWESARPSLWR